MHEEVTSFFEELKGKFPDLFQLKHVLEYGSYDINGGIKKYFTRCEYTGVDWREGPGVDIVSLMHEFEKTLWFKRMWDVIVTTSAIEHDPYWKESLTRCMEILKDGGSLIVTCGGPEYEEHCLDTSPPPPVFSQIRYYKGIDAEEIKGHLSTLTAFSEILDQSTKRDVKLLFRGKIAKEVNAHAEGA